MILDHPIGEALDVGVFRFLSDPAEFDLRHAAYRGLFDKSFVLLVQRIFGGGRGIVAGLGGLGKNWGSGEQSDGNNGGRGEQAKHHGHSGSAFSPSTDTFGVSSLLPELPMRGPSKPAALQRRSR